MLEIIIYYTLSIQAGYSSEVAQEAAVHWGKEDKQRQAIEYSAYVNAECYSLNRSLMSEIAWHIQRFFLLCLCKYSVH